MIARLFGAGRRQGRAAQAPPNTRIYAVGDVHGRADLLERLHDAIRADAARHPDATKLALYIGDYVDRGLHSREVIDQLLAGPLPDFDTVHLKGNHEAMMLDFLDDAAAGAGWMEIGGNATLFSYGVRLDGTKDPTERLADAQSQLRRRLPTDHLGFLKGLRTYHAAGDYFFAHAGVRPGVPLERQSEADLLWIRSDFLESRNDHGKVVVHGHSISWKPESEPNRIGIDTGAFASGVLTCVVLYGAERAFLHAGK